jgi:hypothetical protein
LAGEERPEQKTPFSAGYEQIVASAKAAAGVANQSVLGYSLQLKIPRHMLRGVFILSGLGQEKNNAPDAVILDSCYESCILRL